MAPNCATPDSGYSTFLVVWITDLDDDIQWSELFLLRVYIYKIPFRTQAIFAVGQESSKDFVGEGWKSLGFVGIAHSQKQLVQLDING